MSSLRDLLVGLFVAAGLAAIAYLSISLGGLSYSGPGGLTLVATFGEIGGLSDRAPVVIGGVKVGTVTSIDLDPEYYARVTLDLDGSLELPDDSSVSILTQGVLGDQYIGIEPGASDTFLGDGAEFAHTQDAVILERLIGRVVNSLGDGS